MVGPHPPSEHGVHEAICSSSPGRGGRAPDRPGRAHDRGLRGGRRGPRRGLPQPSWSNIENSLGQTIADAPVRIGTLASCRALTTLPAGIPLIYNCYVSNPNGYTWTHVYTTRINASGWILDGNLLRQGAHEHC